MDLDILIKSGADIDAEMPLNGKEVDDGHNNNTSAGDYSGQRADRS